MIFFTAFVAFCLFSSFMTLALGIYVFAKNPKSTVHQLFLLIMLSATYWAFGEYSLWQAPDYNAFLFWLKVSSFWPLTCAFTLHFILSCTGSTHPGRKWSQVGLAFIYAPAVIFAFAEIGSSMVHTVQFLPGTGFVYEPVVGSLVYLAETAYILILMGASVLVAVSSWWRAEREMYRRQYRLLTAALVVVICFGTLSGVLLPFFGIYLPNLVFIGIVLFSLIITYAIQRYELFTLSPWTAALDIVRTLPDGLIIVDMEGRIIMTNAGATSILNVKEEGLTGHRMEEFISDREVSMIWQELLENGHLSDMEFSTGEENVKVVSVAGSLIRDPMGEPAGAVLILRDITRRKESEQTLRLANEKLSLMTRLTRHDITNLVTALWGYLELMKDHRADPGGEDYLDRCLDLTEKITRHLRFSRDFQDIGVYKPGWQSLRTMFSKAIKDLHCVDIEIMTEIDPVCVYADPLAYKVLYNVLENAIRHGVHVTRITISTRETDQGCIALLIEDNGIGVKYEVKEKIFEHGFGDHTGIGLSLSREILAITGISITETGEPGKGARFEVSIPARAWKKQKDKVEK